MPKVKNVHTGVVSDFTVKEWEATRDNPKYAGRFELAEPEKPAEVKKLESEKPTTQKDANTTAAKDADKK